MLGVSSLCIVDCTTNGKSIRPPRESSNAIGVQNESHIRCPVPDASHSTRLISLPSDREFRTSRQKIMIIPRGTPQRYAGLHCSGIPGAIGCDARDLVIANLSVRQ